MAMPPQLQKADRGICLASQKANLTGCRISGAGGSSPRFATGGHMKMRIIVGAAMVVGLLGVGAFASRGGADVTTTRWAIVHVLDPITVKGRVVTGPVMIVHDDEKMAQGEPCTTIYSFDLSRGPREELVSFHCTPIQRSVAATTQLVTENRSDSIGCKRLLEYQFAGDSEAHGVPVR
jgi:hypothetical protein